MRSSSRSQGYPWPTCWPAPGRGSPPAGAWRVGRRAGTSSARPPGRAVPGGHHRAQAGQEEPHDRCEQRHFDDRVARFAIGQQTTRLKDTSINGPQGGSVRVPMSRLRAAERWRAARSKTTGQLPRTSAVATSASMRTSIVVTRSALGPRLATSRERAVCWPSSGVPFSREAITAASWAAAMTVFWAYNHNARLPTASTTATSATPTTAKDASAWAGWRPVTRGMGIEVRLATAPGRRS